MSQEINLYKDRSNPSWNFEVDQLHTFAFWKNFLSKEECEQIILLAKSFGLKKGKTVDKYSKTRKSDICWLYPSDDLQFLFRRITDVALNLNERFFQFDLFGLNEGLQFSNYTAPSGSFGKHIDRAYGLPVRKLSISIQLTNPDEYEGGELKIYDGSEEGTVASKEQGTLIIFPSYVLHEVSPVTKGERNSLVTWITGKNFK